MATTIVLKNSVTTTNTPSSLAQGEVAINVTDKKVWVGNAATTPIQIVNGGPDGVFTSVTDSGLTNTRVTYAGAGGLLKDSASITTDGTTVTAGGFSGPHNGTVGATTPAAGTFTTLTASSTLSFASQSIPFAALPAGSVLQVVNAVYTTGVSTTSGTLSDTGLTATITPKFSTSKILVLVDQNGGVKTTGADNSIRLVLFRNSTGISTISERAGLTTNSIDMYLSTLSVSYLDNPATTSAVTYKTQYATFSPPNLIYLQLVGCASTITLMEIAA